MLTECDIMKAVSGGVLGHHHLMADCYWHLVHRILLYILQDESPIEKNYPVLGASGAKLKDTRL